MTGDDIRTLHIGAALENRRFWGPDQAKVMATSTPHQVPVPEVEMMLIRQASPLRPLAQVIPMDVKLLKIVEAMIGGMSPVKVNNPRWEAFLNSLLT